MDVDADGDAGPQTDADKDTEGERQPSCMAPQWSSDTDREAHIWLCVLTSLSVYGNAGKGGVGEQGGARSATLGRGSSLASSSPLLRALSGLCASREGRRRAAVLSKGRELSLTCMCCSTAGNWRSARPRCGENVLEVLGHNV